MLWIRQILPQATRQCKSQDNTTEISKLLALGAHFQPESVIEMVGLSKVMEVYAYGIRLEVKPVVLKCYV